MTAPRLKSKACRNHMPRGLGAWLFLSCNLLSCSQHHGRPLHPLSTSLHRVVRCLDPEKGPVELERDRDLVVLVHGCNSSIAKFKNLAEVFRTRGQQAVCFTYDDRDSLVSVANELTVALTAVASQIGAGRVTVIGHSQGGLIARQAVTQADRTPAEVTQLVTISSPFFGIAKARDCGLMPLHILSFGVTVGICQAIAGRKWTEIHGRAPFVTHPAPLPPEVKRHLAILTDERASCRTYEGDACVEDDFVFSLGEQSVEYIGGRNVQSTVVRSGHTAIVGEEDKVPTALISLLQREQILIPPSKSTEAAQQSWLRTLYGEKDGRLSRHEPFAATTQPYE